MGNEQNLREELVKLREEHRRLDGEIGELEATGPANQILIIRLKRTKLRLKDQIKSLENQLLPDIIA